MSSREQSPEIVIRDENSAVSTPENKRHLVNATAVTKSVESSAARPERTSAVDEREGHQHAEWHTRSHLGLQRLREERHLEPAANHLTAPSQWLAEPPERVNERQRQHGRGPHDGDDDVGGPHEHDEHCLADAVAAERGPARQCPERGGGEFTRVCRDHRSSPSASGASDTAAAAAAATATATAACAAAHAAEDAVGLAAPRCRVLQRQPAHLRQR